MKLNNNFKAPFAQCINLANVFIYFQHTVTVVRIHFVYHYKSNNPVVKNLKYNLLPKGNKQVKTTNIVRKTKRLCDHLCC